MAHKTFIMRIQDVVCSPLTYDLYFEENAPLGDQAFLSFPRTWFRNISAPKKGMILRMEQTDGHTLFSLQGQLLASAKTKLSLPAEKLAEIINRQKKAWEKIQLLKERIAHRPKA